MTTNGTQAIVLGGSVAGILAARVLAERCTHVTMVERDRFPVPGVRRRGVPQDRHIHALQTRGKRVIDQLFPGASEELAEQGAVLGDWGRDSTMCFRGHRLRPVETELELAQPRSASPQQRRQEGASHRSEGQGRLRHPFRGLGLPRSRSDRRDCDGAWS